jgi:hypothetical protein
VEGQGGGSEGLGRLELGLPQPAQGFGMVQAIVGSAEYLHREEEEGEKIKLGEVGRHGELTKREGNEQEG